MKIKFCNHLERNSKIVNIETYFIIPRSQFLKEGTAKQINIYLNILSLLI